jgi:heterodisulfide reductase subunit A-like polyferredoxin
LLKNIPNSTVKVRYMSERGLPRFIMCICTGECPGFAKLDLWKFINFVRNELDVEYAIVHPQLCVDDGDRFWRDYLKEGDKNIVYIVGGCDPKMQRKLFGEIFRTSGLDVDRQLVSLDLRNMGTEEAMKKVEEAVNKILGK